MLDGGADIRADAKDLMQYALMGASYARNGFGLTKPRVGLLNVGTEEHKGRAELKEAYDLISANARNGRFRVRRICRRPRPARHAVRCDRHRRLYRQCRTEDRGRHRHADLGAVARGVPVFAPLAAGLGVWPMPPSSACKKRIDPRRANGGVFLGLNGTVVKSHGSADATGVSAAVKLAFQLAETGFTEKLAARVASASMLDQDAATSNQTTVKHE